MASKGGVWVKAVRKAGRGKVVGSREFLTYDAIGAIELGGLRGMRRTSDTHRFVEEMAKARANGGMSLLEFLHSRDVPSETVQVARLYGETYLSANRTNKSGTAIVDRRHRAHMRSNP